MTWVHLAIVALAVIDVATMVGLWWHERREFRRQDAREDRAETRHRVILTTVDSYHRVALGIIRQRTNIEGELQEHEKRIAKLEEGRT